MLDTIIMRLDVQMPAIADYSYEVGARHAKYLGTQYTDPAFWDAFRGAIVDVMEVAAEQQHNKRLNDAC